MPLRQRIPEKQLHTHVHKPSEAEATAMLNAVHGATDPGSRITLIGLCSNISLTIMKGTAGLLLGSAALLADAAHSGSDLGADVVTLFGYRWSRKPKSLTHPWGYGKYESLGTVLVSTLLLGTAVGLGLHSYHLLLEALLLNPAFDPELLKALDVLPHGHSHSHIGLDHDHDHGHNHSNSHGAVTDATVDARAMVFAGLAVVIKEWLYRATLKVAKSQQSNVLMANAYHHRSDAFGSMVALAAIGGSYIGYPILDPLGGLVVSGVIFRQGVMVGLDALKQLTDQTSGPETNRKIYDAVIALRDPKLAALPEFGDSKFGVEWGTRLDEPEKSSGCGHGHGHSHSHEDHSHSHETQITAALPIMDIKTLRTLTSGPTLIVDVEVTMPPKSTLEEVEKRIEIIEAAVKQACGAKKPGSVGGREVQVGVRIRSI